MGFQMLPENKKIVRREDGVVVDATSMFELVVRFSGGRTMSLQREGGFREDGSFVIHIWNLPPFKWKNGDILTSKDWNEVKGIVTEACRAFDAKVVTFSEEEKATA